MEREGVSILSIRSFLRVLRCLAHLKKTPCALCFEKKNSSFENALVRQFALS